MQASLQGGGPHPTASQVQLEMTLGGGLLLVCMNLLQAAYLLGATREGRSNLPFHPPHHTQSLACTHMNTSVCSRFSTRIMDFNECQNNDLLQAGYLLGATLEEHPAMAPVVVKEIERFLFRPGIAPRARYYAIVFLNQQQLSHDAARGRLLAAGVLWGCPN